MLPRLVGTGSGSVLQDCPGAVPRCRCLANALVNGGSGGIVSGASRSGAMGRDQQGRAPQWVGGVIGRLCGPVQKLSAPLS